MSSRGTSAACNHRGGSTSLPICRLIRWIVALVDRKIVPFTMYEMVNGARAGAIVESGDVTHGHRFLPRGNGGQRIKVTSFADLLKKLEESYVLLDPAAREA